MNTLILRVDYNYAYEKHPELRDDNPLTKEDVKKLVAACRKNNIRLIPQVNLLGHQSWANKNEKLLRDCLVFYFMHMQQFFKCSRPYLGERGGRNFK